MAEVVISENDINFVMQWKCLPDKFHIHLLKILVEFVQSVFLLEFSGSPV